MYSSSPSSSSPPPSKLPLSPPAQPLSPSPYLSHNYEPRLHHPQESRPTPPPKKSQPFPWTHQETLALISAYQEKWYSLKKGPLKAFQWEEVSVTVAARCGLDEPSKTSTQCRHKIEKLRQRYRSELQKPYPINSWQYFELMDQMERGPLPLNARPIAAVKSFPDNGNSNTHGYGGLYSRSGACYYSNNDYSYGDGCDSDDSDEKLNTGHGSEAVTKNLNKIGITNSERAAMERGFRSSKTRFVRVPKNPINGEQKQYDGDDSNDDGGDGNDRGEDENDQECDGGMELASEVRIFAEKFIGMENKKMEMLRETQRYRMDMERKRMGMIFEARSKIMDTIDRAFGAHKKAKLDSEKSARARPRG
ncbi:hypothetical protein OROMI_015510 [Orobanche minor]